MTPKPLALFSILVLLTGGCTHVPKNEPIKINIDQNSPVRMHVYDWTTEPEKENKNTIVVNKQILILPPLGIDDTKQQDAFYRQLYGGAQRRFATPFKVIRPDSAYAPYIADNNLMRNDGSLDIGEIAFLGALMNCTHVICPNVRELNPYHPQRIDLSLIIINSGSSKVCAELTAVFDAKESDVFDYFIQYSTNHKQENESKDDLGFKIKSPVAFQGFVADMCTTVIADKLSL
ncbi:hypothetical protein P4C99_17845 [Pontiellaceae bacterium B1224]|nr:hypothetical protein [Pontiellaceae bacterium B1224]